jgi:hypothetical protein
MSRRIVGVEQPKPRDIIETFCDVCGEVAEPATMYRRHEATIESVVGSSYPEGDDTETTWIDVCSHCFSAKVVPALEAALGVKFRRCDSEDRHKPEAGQHKGERKAT